VIAVSEKHGEVPSFWFYIGTEAVLKTAQGGKKTNGHSGLNRINVNLKKKKKKRKNKTVNREGKGDLGGRKGRGDRAVKGKRGDRRESMVDQGKKKKGTRLKQKKSGKETTGVVPM